MRSNGAAMSRRIGAATRSHPEPCDFARSYLAGDSLVTLAMPVLQALAAMSGETCALYVRQGHDRILVQNVASPHPLRHTTPIGERLPLHLGASGQVLCMGMAPEKLDAYLGSVAPTRLASGSVLSKADMLERIEDVRRRGYAVAVDERFMGVSAVAAPIVNGSKMVAAARTSQAPAAGWRRKWSSSRSTCATPRTTSPKTQPLVVHDFRRSATIAVLPLRASGERQRRPLTPPEKARVREAGIGKAILHLAA